MSAMNANEARLKGVLETAIDGIITIFPDGKIESANQAVSGLFGYTGVELIGQNVSILMPEPHRSAHDSYINNYLETGLKKIIGIGREVKGQRKDGTLFDFYLSVSEVQLEGGLIFTGIIHDITEIKQAEERLQKLNDQLEEKVELRTEELTQTVNQLLQTKRELEKEVSMRKEAEDQLKVSNTELALLLEKEKELSQLKSHFVTLASHEFRTPLSTILSSATLIGRYEDTEAQDKRLRHINKIKASVNNLTNILEDFLSTSKLEEGKISINLEEIQLPEFIRELASGFEESENCGIQIEVSGLEKPVRTDPQILQNILLNLLSNACKYSPEPRKVSLSAEETTAGVKIQIADKGIGIPLDEQKNLFERFFRASNAADIKGTGLGLHIVKQYVELLNGTISLESIPEEGTTVTIVLPNRLA